MNPQRSSADDVPRIRRELAVPGTVEDLAGRLGWDVPRTSRALLELDAAGEARPDGTPPFRWRRTAWPT